MDNTCMHAKLLYLCLILCNPTDPMDCSLPGSSVHGILPGKNTGMGCHPLLQGIFLTQESNPRLLRLLHWQVGSLPTTSATWINTSGQQTNKVLKIFFTGRPFSGNYTLESEFAVASDIISKCNTILLSDF